MSHGKKDQAAAAMYEALASFMKAADEAMENIRGGRHFADSLHDQSYFNVIEKGLDIISVDAVLFRSAGSSQWMGCFRAGIGKTVRDAVVADIEAIKPGSGDIFEVESEEDSFVKCVFQIVRHDEVVLINPANRIRQKDSVGWDSLAPLWYTVASTFADLFREFLRAYGWPPPKEIYTAWAQLEQHKAVKWSLGSLKTITVSLDLRKSTFAMEQARNQAAFAGWMMELVGVLTHMAQQSGAWFDKFTGDGVLIHYQIGPSDACPGDEGQAQKADQAQQRIKLAETMERAVTCAAKMVVEVDRRLDALRANLHNDSGLFGAGVGIAVGDAEWRTDREGRLMVVGRGVVGACRAGDKALAGRIRLINSAYQDFRDTKLARRLAMARATLDSKDFGSDMDVSVWEVCAINVLAAANHIPSQQLAP